MPSTLGQQLPDWAIRRHRVKEQEGSAPRRSLVLHVVPEDLARGAQVHARELRYRLDSPTTRHRLVLLFGRGRSVTQADVVLGSTAGPGRRFGFSLSAYLRLAVQVATERPDVIVAHGGEPLKYVGLLPFRTRRVYHRIGSGAPASRLSLRLHRLVARRFDRLVGVGTVITRQAQEALNFPPDRVFVIHNGRDASVFAPSRAPRSWSPPRLLFVGHLVEGKRPAAVAALPKRLGALAASVTIVGDGPLLEQLRHQFRGVEFTGRRDDIAQIMRCHDVFVFPSNGEGEGLPGVLIEAALCGLPIVTTAVPGAEEVVDDGHTGLIVPLGDDDALTAAVSTLLRDPERREVMGSAGRARAESKFDIERCMRSWSELIDGLLRGDELATKCDDVVER